MQHLLHHNYQSKGLIKNSYANFLSRDRLFSYGVNGKKAFMRIPIPTLRKGTTHISEDVTTNKIKVIGYELRLKVQSIIPAPASSQQVIENAPAKLVVATSLQQEGTTSIFNTFNTASYNELYVRKRSTYRDIAGTIGTECQDAYSNYRLPLLPRWKIWKELQQNLTVPSHYMFNTQFSARIHDRCYAGETSFDIKDEIDAYIQIPDDGNVNTIINLDNCLGEIPTFCVFLADTHTQDVGAFVSRFNFEGSITIIYEEWGTFLSHLG